MITMLPKDIFFLNSRCISILDSVKNEIILINKSNEIIFLNKSAAKLLGNDCSGKKFDSFIPKDEISKLESAKKEIKAVSLKIASKKYDVFIKKEEDYFTLTLEDANYVESAGKISLLNRMLNIFSTEKDLKKIIDSILEELLNFFNFTFGGIYLVEGEYLLLKGQKNVPINFAKKVSKIKVEGNYKDIFEKKSATMIDYEKFNPKEAKNFGIKLLVSVPIINEGKNLGLINLASDKKITLDPKLIDNIDKLANVFGNIIKNKESEKSSKINEDRFNAISHITDEFILILDKEGKITYSSRSFSKLGYEREELIGLAFQKICKNCSEDLLKKSKAVLNIADSIGSIHLFETSINTIISDGSTVLLSRDITEKRSFDELIKSEKNKLQEYLDNIPLIFLALDINGNVEMVNKTGCSILKVKKEEVLGKLWFDNFLPENARKIVKKTFFAAIYGEKKEYAQLISNRYENEILCSDGEIKLVEWNNSLIKDNKGVINLILAVGRDITKEKEKEKEIEELKKTKELGEMRRNFLMLVTHELKQPLTPIMGYADLLKENIVDIEKLKFLDRIINGGQDMLDLITRIINLMKLESGELMFNFKEVSIQRIIEEALKKKAAFINLKSIRIEKKIKDVNFMGDFNLLRDVMLNLFDNAIKFSPEKTVITIKTKAEKSNLKVEVIDQGVGMEKEDAENLFKSFKQSEIGRKRGGFGIGLAMSKMIVEHHKGTIHARSAPGKGSTFTVIIPLKKDLGEKK